MSEYLLSEWFSIFLMVCAHVIVHVTSWTETKSTSLARKFYIQGLPNRIWIFNFLDRLRIHWSVWEFIGASVNLLERLRASQGFWNFDGASEIFGSVCEMYGTKKMPPGKNAPQSMHQRDQGALDEKGGIRGLVKKNDIFWEFFPT